LAESKSVVGILGDFKLTGNEQNLLSLMGARKAGVLSYGAAFL
jgi:hypothetical protein